MMPSLLPETNMLLRADVSGFHCFALEFSLSGIPSGSVVTSCVLFLREQSDTGGGSTTHGYRGDGAVTLADMTVNNPIGTSASSGAGNGVQGDISLDVTTFMQTCVTGGYSHAGFTFVYGTGAYTVYSSESTTPDLRPRLTIGMASDLTIQSSGGAGRLTFDTIPGAAGYRIEWAPTPAGPWTNSWASLVDIPGPGSGSITCSVPMCYRVVATQ
jgi:hypothetical protein